MFEIPRNAADSGAGQVFGALRPESNSQPVLQEVTATAEMPQE